METYVRMTDLDSKFVSLPNVSTLAEYHAAGPGVDTRAGRHIDAELTPYLVNKDFDEMGFNPYFEIIDLFIKPSRDFIGVDIVTGREWLPGDALVTWR